MSHNDIDFALSEKTLHTEMVFAIRKFFFLSKAPRKMVHNAVFDVLKPLFEEAKQYCEIWEDEDIENGKPRC